MDKNCFSVNRNIIELYQRVSLSGYLAIEFRHKKGIKEFNDYTLDFLVSNPGTNVRDSSLTIYNEKINQIYHDKK